MVINKMMTQRKLQSWVNAIIKVTKKAACPRLSFKVLCQLTLEITKICGVADHGKCVNALKTLAALSWKVPYSNGACNIT